MPPSLLKEHLNDFIPTLADIINNSLWHGKFPDKLKKVVLFGTRQQLEKLGEDNTFEIKIGSEVIKPTPSARNLGFHMEAQLKS